MNWIPYLNGMLSLCLFGSYFIFFRSNWTPTAQIQLIPSYIEGPNPIPVQIKQPSPSFYVDVVMDAPLAYHLEFSSQIWELGCASEIQDFM